MAVRLIKIITSVSILDELEKAIRDAGIIDVWKTVDLEKNTTFFLDGDGLFTHYEVAIISDLKGVSI